MPKARLTATSTLLALTMLGVSCGSGEGDADTTTGETTDAADNESSASEDDGESGTGQDADTGSAPDDDPDDGDQTDADQADDDPADDGDETDENDEDEDEATGDLVITGSLAGGEITLDALRFDVDAGSNVRIEFTSDEAEHIHVHGYDLLADVGPDLIGEISFVADSPGTFEVELENSGRFLFEILVR